MNLIKRNHTNFPSMMDEFLKPDWFGGFQNFSLNTPAVNIKETDTDFTIELAAPGKQKEDFNIEVDNKVLTISSEAKNQHEETDKNGRYTRKEFSYSAFKRAFTLPDTINENDIKANYESGVLHIQLPKREDALPKAKRLIDIM
ncbi:Hsp20/alpha crystallin family protein [Flavobacterium sp. XGLA_31]|uniref:Hsp20/alpha crystallin family protein n=1 Tax=Flavobacterium sp. XGLA_31 TaxID=3447666 RepID=UPI003F3FFD03